MNIVVGAGYAGSICAHRIAHELDEPVLLLEKRSHIAGNMYDYPNEHGIMVHQYGPHIAVMREERVFNYLSRFTQWIPYEHQVKALIDGREVCLPINFHSILDLFDHAYAHSLIRILLDAYGPNANVPILELRGHSDSRVRQMADYIYEKVFLHYTMKMWGLAPDQLDPAVTGRIPVRLSFDNRHFLHPFQVMPKDGYTALFENMLDHPHIRVQTCTDALELLKIDTAIKSIRFDGKPFHGRLVYTGALDELLDFRFGSLPYRSLRFEVQTFPVDAIQCSPVLNWPDERPATRRTEMKKLTGQVIPGVTTAIVEYPGAYDRQSLDYHEPYYPILRSENTRLFQRYLEALADIPGLYTLGRLADYQYYNMEECVKRAIGIDLNDRN